MSILSSARRAITGVLDTIGDVALAAQETVGMGTSFVHDESVAFKKTHRESVLIRMSESMLEMSSKLEADPKLAAIHETLSKELSW